MQAFKINATETKVLVIPCLRIAAHLLLKFLGGNRSHKTPSCFVNEYNNQHLDSVLKIFL